MDSYFLCGTPRSGSTLLCTLLSDTKNAGRPDSYFRKNSIVERSDQFQISHLVGADFDRAYLTSVIDAGQSKSGVFGLRIMWDTFIELDEILGRAFPNHADFPQRLDRAFGTIKFVFLKREDVVAQAVSLLKAKQGGLWHMASDGTPLQQRPNKRPLVYDRVRISKLVAEMEEHNAGWEAWFRENGVSPLRLTYEHLADNPIRELQRVLDHINVPLKNAEGAKPKTARLADHVNQNWVDRYKSTIG